MEYDEIMDYLKNCDLMHMEDEEFGWFIPVTARKVVINGNVFEMNFETLMGGFEVDYENNSFDMIVDKFGDLELSGVMKFNLDCIESFEITL